MLDEFSEVELDWEIFEKVKQQCLAKLPHFYQLVNENVEEYISDKPFVSQRLKVSYAFIDDCVTELRKLQEKVRKCNFQSFDDFVNKVPQYNFFCKNAKEYEKDLQNNDVQLILCNIVFQKIPHKQEYFGITYDLNDKIVVSINEFVEELTFSIWGEQAGLTKQQIIDKKPVDYIEAMITRIQHEGFHNHKYVHEFQHVMQILHNKCSDDKYDLDGDDKLASSTNLEQYYNCITEKEAFLISYIYGMQQMNTNFNSYEDVCKNCKALMKSDYIDEKYFWIFDKCLKKLFNLNESKIDNDLLQIINKLEIENKNSVLKRTKEILAMSKEEKQKAFNTFLKRGFK